MLSLTLLRRLSSDGWSVLLDPYCLTPTACSDPLTLNSTCSLGLSSLLHVTSGLKLYMRG